MSALIDELFLSVLNYLCSDCFDKAKLLLSETITNKGKSLLTLP